MVMRTNGVEDSAMCSLYLNVVMCIAWCEVLCGRDVEMCADVIWCELLCDVKCGAMLQFQTRCD